jgi:hypothetical protein
MRKENDRKGIKGSEEKMEEEGIWQGRNKRCEGKTKKEVIW